MPLQQNTFRLQCKSVHFKSPKKSFTLSTFLIKTQKNTETRHYAHAPVSWISLLVFILAVLGAH